MHHKQPKESLSAENGDNFTGKNYDYDRYLHEQQCNFS